MFEGLKQFVPSKVCLSCEGCCRFLLADSAWRPKLGQEESLGVEDARGYLPTEARQGHHQCVFFDPAQGSCGVYAKRPFECALYPFILSSHGQGPSLYMHWACPYIQDQQVSPELEAHIAYLKLFFQGQAVKDFLRRNSRLLHDYGAYDDELKFLFSIEA